MHLLLFTVARLRLLTLAVLALAHLGYAHENSLFTSSVSYCATPKSLLIQQFDVAYIASNSSVNFNISAASVVPNITVSANLLLNAYGMHLVNLTIDLCSLLNGALCPLPMYNFTGADSIPLSSYVDVSGKVPGIAYQVPDLEGYVQLTLINKVNGSIEACVQATLSNGWSMRQVAVEWATGGLALLALASALWQSVYPDSLAPYRLLDLVNLYQSVAVSGLLSLNYPVAYSSFALNFAWAIGLFSFRSFQTSIDNMRTRTGGYIDDSGGGSAVALTNRKLSPYNAIVINPNVANSLTSRASTVNTEPLSNRPESFLSSSLRVGNATIFDSQQVATVTTTSSNVLGAGIPIYANTLNISSANAFMTVFFIVLISVAVALGIVVVVLLTTIVLIRFGLIKHERALRLKETLPTAIKSWFLRLAMILFTPVIIFSFYQWTLKDSWLSVLLSVILFLSISTPICYSVFLAMRWKDFDDIPFHIPLWGQYRSNRHWFFLALMLSSFCKAVFVSFAKDHGMVQVILTIVVEFGVLACVLTFKPHSTRGADVLSTYLSIVRLVCTGLLIAFVQDLGVAPIPRAVIGIVMAVIFSVAVIVMFINIVFHSIDYFRSRQFTQRIPSPPQSAISVLEKGKS